MRVVFLIRCFLYYTAELANALARLSHEVVIIASDRCGEFVGVGGPDLQGQFRELLDPEVALEWVHLPERTSPSTLLDTLRSISHMRKLVSSYRPDVVHVHDVADYRIFAAIGLARRTFRLVLTIHDAELHPGDSPNKVEFLRPWLRRMADGVIVHGEDIKRRLLDVTRIPGSRIYTIPHGSYTLHRRWLSPGGANAGRNVLFFGRVHEYKGLEYLIRSAPIVCRKVPGTKFVIAGSGPAWPGCKALIENLEDFILHEGAVYDPDVTRLFEDAAVVALPYIEASQSGVLAIAYALGKPVVVTDVGALPEVVEDGVTGLVVPARNAEALAEAIVKILTNDELRERMSQNAYQRATTTLSWDCVARQTEEVYRKMTAR